MLMIGHKPSERPAAILSFSFIKATPSGFAPWRQLPRPTTGALHCTGTVAGGFSGGYRLDICPGSAATASGL